MSYTVFVDYDEDYYNIGSIENLHEAIRIAEKEMEPGFEDDIEVRHTFVIDEQKNLTVWHSNDPPELKAYDSYSYDEWNTLKHGHHIESDKPSVYFDIDGTLGKWYVDGRGFSYEEIINPQNHYFRDIEPHDMMILLAKKLQEDGVDVCIISAADKNTIRDKWEWIEEHLPFVPKENICFSPIGADKSKFVKGNAEISILIDDYNKNLQDWKGTSIKAINTVNSHQDKFAEIDFTYSEKLLKDCPGFFVTDVDPWIRNEINNSLLAAAEGIMNALEKISEMQKQANVIEQYMFDRGAYKMPDRPSWLDDDREISRSNILRALKNEPLKDAMALLYNEVMAGASLDEVDDWVQRLRINKNVLEEQFEKPIRVDERGKKKNDIERL